MSNREIAITITGWVADNPHGGKCDNGSSHVSFRVIHNSRYRRADGTWKEREAIGMTIRCFGIQADNVKSSIRKGTPVVVSGRLQCSTWIDKETSKKRSILEVIASSVGIDLSLGECVFRRVKAENKISTDSVYFSEELGEETDTTVEEYSDKDPDVWHIVPEAIRESSLETVLQRAKDRAAKEQADKLEKELLPDKTLVA